MDDILFSSEAADKINQEVREKVADHLFLVCNYDPEMLTSINPDGRFYVAVLNFYKFLIDGNVYSKLSPALKSYNISYKYRTISQNKNLISDIRAVVAHTVSTYGESYGRYCKWLMSVIHKKELETDDDYGKAVDDLRTRADNAEREFLSMVDAVGKNTDKADIIEVWENAIISFYCKGDMKYIKEQIVRAYVAYHPNVKSVIWYDVAVWTGERLKSSYDEELNKWTDVKLQYYDRMDSSKKQLLESKITAAKAELDEFESEVILHKRDTDTTDDYIYINYFLDTFDVKMHQYLQDKKTIESMQPEYMIQDIVYDDLKLK